MSTHSNGHLVPTDPGTLANLDDTTDIPNVRDTEVTDTATTLYHYSDYTGVPEDAVESPETKNTTGFKAALNNTKVVSEVKDVASLDGGNPHEVAHGSNP